MEYHREVVKESYQEFIDYIKRHNKKIKYPCYIFYFEHAFLNDSDEEIEINVPFNKFIFEIKKDDVIYLDTLFSNKEIREIPLVEERVTEDEEYSKEGTIYDYCIEDIHGIVRCRNVFGKNSLGISVECNY